MSSDTTSVRSQIIASLADKGYRDLLVQESITQGIAFQIRANRSMRGWTQGELGVRARKAQSEISRYEDPDYESYTLKTLTSLASAFDVALSVRFVPFSEVVDDMTHERLKPLTTVSFSEDQALVRRKTPELGLQRKLDLTSEPQSTITYIADYLPRLTTSEGEYSWQTTQVVDGL